MGLSPDDFNRRGFARICLAALAGGKRLLPAAQREPLTWAALPDSGPGLERRYRVDAQVILLSIPLLRRQGVGEGSSSWRESRGKDGAELKLLEFSGQSSPEHAAGLNRFGFIQELSRSTEREGTDSLYFGVMTSSPEESAEEARKALHSTAKEATYSAIDARITASAIETTNASFVGPLCITAADRTALINKAREALAGGQKRTVPWRSGSAPLPFLHALAAMLTSRDATETRYAYNGRMYRLRIERGQDAKAAAAYRGRGIISAGAGVTLISAVLRREEGGKAHEFRLWIEEGSPRPLPLRIEYQPKSYLRLVFEA